jgi:hypothetical protein
LSPTKAKAEDSWGSLEPHFDSQHRPTGSGTLWLCIPIEGKRHKSVQAGVGDGVIVGGWQDRHYAWDDARQEAFRRQFVEGTEGESITELLSWVEGELLGLK